jgi:hypothetical protein
LRFIYSSIELFFPEGDFFFAKRFFFSFGQDAVGVLQIEIDADGACSKSAGNRELGMDERSEDRQNSFFYIIHKGRTVNLKSK